MQVRIFSGPTENDGRGAYEFDVLPRAGEEIRLNFKGSSELYKVARVLHLFHDHTKAPMLALFVDRVG